MAKEVLLEFRLPYHIEMSRNRLYLLYVTNFLQKVLGTFNLVFVSFSQSSNCVTVYSG
jgi:predicted transcriptional regulator